MSGFDTKCVAARPDTVAPDGSDVRLLLELEQGGMAHFTLAPGEVSRAMAHKTVAEIWYIVAGKGRMWRKDGLREQTVSLAAGVAISIPTGTHFQFRSDSDQPLEAVAVTMPPWPGVGEARPVAPKWTETV